MKARATPDRRVVFDTLLHCEYLETSMNSSRLRHDRSPATKPVGIMEPGWEF